MKTSIISVLTGIGLLVLGSISQGEILGDYLSYNACVDCHAETVESWKKTDHAHAWDNLKTQGEEKQSIPGCFKCHVVAYNEDGGFMDMDITPELKDVQCEACHGAGLAHVESEGDPELIVGKPGEDVCRTCHTKGQDKKFDYVAKVKKLNCGTPR